MIRRFRSLALAAAIVLPAVAHAQNRGDFHWDKALPAGNEVEVHNVNGDIRIVPSTTGRVEVTGTKHGGADADRLRADVQQTSRGVVVCVIYDDPSGTCDDNDWSSGRRNRSRRNGNWDNASMNLEVAVPTNLLVFASSVSGDVSITGAHGDVSANTVSGDIKLDRLHATAVTAHSVSGDVSVRIDELSGRGDLSFHTVSGDVTLDMPRQLDADLTMSTVSGDLNSDFPITLGNGRMSRRSIQARIGNGGRRLELHTVSGSVRIRKSA